LHPTICDRIGVRYVDRVTGDQLARLRRLVRPEILGVAGVEAALGSATSCMRCPTRCSSSMTLRNSVVGGAGFQRGQRMTWRRTGTRAILVLDLDHYTSQPEDFDLAAIGGKVTESANASTRSSGGP